MNLSKIKEEIRKEWLVKCPAGDVNIFRFGEKFIERMVDRVAKEAQMHALKVISKGEGWEDRQWDWEKDLGERFLWIKIGFPDQLEKIKDFIRNLLSEEKEKLINKIKKL